MELLLFVLMVQLSSVLSVNEEVFDAKLYTGDDMKRLLTGIVLSKDLKTDRSSVGGILVHRVEDETFILLASERGEDAGKVCELGGEGKGGESLLATLKREVNEESGRHIDLKDRYIFENSQLFYRTSTETAKGVKLIRHPAFVFIHTYYPNLYDTGVLEKAAEEATGDAKEKDKFYWISICSLLKADENILRKEKERVDNDEPESETVKNEIEVDVLLPNRPDQYKVLLGKKKITLRYWFGVNMLNEHFRNALGSQIMAPPVKGPHANQGSWKSVCKLM